MDHGLIPWGLTRMEPYPHVIPAAGSAVALDPRTQTTVYDDGTGFRREMGRHGTGTGRETRTLTSGGDSVGPQNTDQGHDQESDQDEGS
mgnify:CR=1 FL=1